MPRRRPAGGRQGLDRPPWSRSPSRASFHPQLKRSRLLSGVAGAPRCRGRQQGETLRLRAAGARPMPVVGEWTGGRRRLGGRTCHSCVESAVPLVPGVQELQLHPPLPEGDGLCAQALLHPQMPRRCEPSYKDVLMRQGVSGRQGERSVSMTASVSAAANVQELVAISEEDRQVVKTNHPQSRTVPQPNSEVRRQNEHRLLYLRKMKGRCFNCLARDHKVASCCDPTRCWRRRRFGHTSRECLPSSSVPPSADSTPHIINHHPSTEDISTPVLPRSEAEQLVGQELINALRDFKQLTD